jgi:anti-sigma regulatory factor (Ser/Thr protein kinase)
MLHVNISHTEYAQALKALQDACPDLWHVTIAIDFSADHAQSKIIRDFVGLIFTYHRVNTPWWGRFTLITDELINNAIEHGSSAGDIDSCLIESWRDKDGEFYINLEVHDTGTGKDAKTAEEMATVKEKHKKDNSNGTYMKKRGRWLFHITEKLVDRLEFRESPKRWPCCTYREGYTKKYLDRPFPLRKYLNTSDENWF